MVIADSSVNGTVMQFDGHERDWYVASLMSVLEMSLHCCEAFFRRNINNKIEATEWLEKEMRSG